MSTNETISGSREQLKENLGGWGLQEKNSETKTKKHNISSSSLS